MKEILNNEIKSVIQEYKDFCAGVDKKEAINFIYKNIRYDYDLPEDANLLKYIEDLYNISYIPAENAAVLYEDTVNEENLEETYSDDELDKMVGKVYNIRKITDWYRNDSGLYAHTICTKCGREKDVFLSNLINDPEKYGSCICSDTNIDGKIDYAQQLYTGGRKLKSNTSGYTGVSFVRTYKGQPYNKWRAYIEVDGKRTYLGDFEKKKDAIKARKTAAEKGVKWYKDNRNKITRDLRRKTKKYKNSKYRDSKRKTINIKG